MSAAVAAVGGYYEGGDLLFKIVPLGVSIFATNGGPLLFKSLVSVSPLVLGMFF